MKDSPANGTSAATFELISGSCLLRATERQDIVLPPNRSSLGRLPHATAETGSKTCVSLFTETVRSLTPARSGGRVRALTQALAEGPLQAAFEAVGVPGNGDRAGRLAA